MDQLFLCEYCEKEFTSKSSLNHHQRTAKYCLIKRGSSNNKFECEYCDKHLTTHERLTSHLISCKYKKKIEESIELERQKNEFEKQKTQYENDLKKQKDYYENELEKQKNVYENVMKQKDEYISKIEQMLEKSSETIAEIAKQPTTTNNSNNSTNNTNSSNTNNSNNFLVNRFDINDISKLSTILDQHLTPNVLKRGQEGLADMLKTHLLQDEKGDPLYECTDVARQHFEFRNPDGNIETDPKATKLIRNLGRSGIWNKAHKVGKKIWEKPDGSVNNEAQTVYMPNVTEVLDMDNDSKRLRSRLATITARQKKAALNKA